MRRAHPCPGAAARAWHSGARTETQRHGIGAGTDTSATARHAARRTPWAPARTQGRESRAEAGSSALPRAPARPRAMRPVHAHGRPRPFGRRRSVASFLAGPCSAPIRPQPGWTEHWAAPPSPRNRSRRIREGAGRSEELEKDPLARVRAPGAELQDPRVAAVALRVARSDLLEQAVNDELVLAERGRRLPASVLVTALGEGDQLLDLRLGGLGLCFGRLDPLVLDDLLGEVQQQRLAVRRVAAELVSLLLVAHDGGKPSCRADPGREPSASPRPPRSTCDRSSGLPPAPTRTSAAAH